MNYLASPAAGDRLRAGRHHGLRLRDPAARPGHRRQRRVPARHLAHRPRTCRTPSTPRSTRTMFTKDYADVFAGDERWTLAAHAGGQHLRVGPGLDLRAQAPVLRRHAARAVAGRGHQRGPGAGPARRLGDHRPHLPRRLDQGRHARPGSTSTSTASDKKDFNSYGSRRGNHEVMIRGTFANIRLRNQLLDNVSGGYTRDFTAGRRPAGVHLRRRAELRRGRDPAGGAGRQGVRLRLVAGLGGQGHRAARGEGGDRGVLRAHPPVEPDRDGRAAAAVPGRRVGRARCTWTAPRPSTSAGSPR